ncbi:serine kinase/phosphatase [Pseudomonas typographi]|uniref:Serine kinase/phosphatase n=1 Tax=Pseudomonas typographi TaxID=2715964 RepID=A0ABR7Z6Q6_9PSED|nr:serine kinase/phosphatase [Pseudomonas typographi]MBD1554479.1 serine kinase/phosphatase [Pseudomonas typographi]MBD1590145.1 serine kinase/phosphatase [Pseudomonas typographi]MBD1601082.1 serine kinase/phosphatase [Pseudomonas typographi]
MTRPQRPLNAEEPLPIDDDNDRMGSVHPLDFDDTDEPSGKIGDELPADERAQELSAQRTREAGMTGASTDDHHNTEDDLAPEVLIREDGARSSQERGKGKPADRDLSEADSDHIGAGHGFDEEELAHIKPLDGKPE